MFWGNALRVGIGRCTMYECIGHLLIRSFQSLVTPQPENPCQWPLMGWGRQQHAAAAAGGKGSWEPAGPSAGLPKPPNN